MWNSLTRYLENNFERFDRLKDCANGQSVNDGALYIINFHS